MIVQELFKNIDIRKLANKLVENYEYEKDFVEEHGYEEYVKIIELTINDFLSITPTISDDYVIVYKTYDLFDDEETEYLDASIVHLEDIKRNIETIKSLITNYDLKKDRDRDNSIDVYGMDLVERNILLGYTLCENCLDKYEKYDILAALFDELTFFGYLNETNEEKVEEETNILQERIDEIKEHPERLIPMDKAMEEIFGEDWKKEYESIKLPTREELDKCATKNRKEIFDEIKWIIEKLRL